MSMSNRYDVFDGYTQRLIRRKALELSRHPRFSEGDRADIEQDLATHILRCRSLFDSERAKFETFVTRIVDAAISRMIRTRETLKRGSRITFESIDTLVPDEDRQLIPLKDTLANREGFRCDQERCDLSADLAKAMNSLPPRLQAVCEQLKAKSPQEVVSEGFLSSSELDSAIQEIRATFRRLGMDGYCR